MSITYLEHLDKSNTQVQVCFVSTNQAQTEEDADRDNRAEVYAARHRHLLPRVEYGGETRKELGHDGSEDEMPCRQEDSCDC